MTFLAVAYSVHTRREPGYDTEGLRTDSMGILRLVLPHRRLLAALSLLLHLGVVGLVPLADASLESRTPDQAAVHMEGEDNPHCRPVHNHFYCQVCRVLDAGSLTPATPAPAQFAVALLLSPPTLHRSVLPSSAPTSALGPRAPPTA